VAYGLYLCKMLWPVRLALYPIPHAPGMAVDFVGAGLISITALVVIFRRKRYLPVAGFGFWGRWFRFSPGASGRVRHGGPLRLYPLIASS